MFVSPDDRNRLKDIVSSNVLNAETKEIEKLLLIILALIFDVESLETQVGQQQGALSPDGASNANSQTPSGHAVTENGLLMQEVLKQLSLLNTSTAILVNEIQKQLFSQMKPQTSILN